LTCVLGFALPFAGVVAWDSPRWGDTPSYWHQGASSYGGLSWAPVVEWGERLVEWFVWARYLSGSRVLAILLVLGIATLLVDGWRHRPGTRPTWLDTLWVVYGLAYIVAHAVLQFSVWDRYLLPLAPLLALLVARIVQSVPKSLTTWRTARAGASGSAPSEVRTHQEHNKALSLRALVSGNLLPSAVLILLLLSAWTAAQNGYPIGGEHWAYQGLDQVAAYLKENAPADAVIYHHWLRWHYTYYLHDTAFELRWWASGEHLQREALRTPERAQYIVLPDWRTLEPDTKGVALHRVYETRRQDGSTSFTVHRLELQQEAAPLERASKEPADGTRSDANER
jgi:hypothetical protein